MRRFLVLLAFFVFSAVAHPVTAAASEKRFALVVGNAAYRAKTLPASVNDAILIAQTLQASGFEVSSLRNLNEAGLRQGFRDFLSKVKSAGPDTIVAVYFAGLGLQCDGENYLLPVDADISQASDVLHHALPLSEQTHSLAALHLKASFLIIDAARASPFLLSGRPPASGLAWMEPEANMLLAFNATPGTVAPDSTQEHGAYAVALAEMIRRGGLSPEALFDRVRLRVDELTGGAQVPWDAATIQTQLAFNEHGGGAPPLAEAADRTTWMRSQPMRKLGPDDAYWTALLRDTFDGYAEFLAEYWNGPMAKRIEALLAARREAITWRRSNQANVPDAYWTYLERYPRGPHVSDAERLLLRLGAATTPPANFKRVDFDVPPPLPAERKFTDQPVLRLDDPAFALAPLKSPPAYFLGPLPSDLQALVQPAAPSGERALPRPSPSTLPADVSIPAETSARPDQPAISTSGPTSGGARSDNPGTREGPGGSPPASGGLGSKPVSNSDQSPALPSVSQVGVPGSPALAAAQPGASKTAKASSRLSLPAWASLLPKEDKASAPLGTSAPAASNEIGEPLFVSAALAQVSPKAEPKLGAPLLPNVRSGPGAAPPAGSARLSQGSTRPLTTGSIAPATIRSVAPHGGRGRAPPGAVRALRTGNLTPPRTRPTPVAATAEPGTSSRAPGQAPLRKRKPPLTLVPNPEVSSAAPAQRPPKNPCTISNGRLNCDDPR